MAQTLDPPYYAVIFSNQRREDNQGYETMAARMEALARRQPGFLGLESARNDEGFGITVSYWKNLDAIRRWKDHAEHQVAQRLGREKWYQTYCLRICRVEHESVWG